MTGLITETALSYDDVLLRPQYSSVESRSDVETSTTLGGLELEEPFISAPMDTVTEEEMAQSISDAGGMGFIHRFMSIEEQIKIIESIDGNVGGTIGVEEPYVENAKRLHEAGADIICLDIAHGLLQRCIEATKEISDAHPEIRLCVGNVATREGVEHLALAGADIVKVGVGPGSHCLTREVTGVGVPQFTAVLESCKHVENLGLDVDIIADGGVQNSGDAAKALLGAGADAIMAGGLFAGCKEAPTEQITHQGQKYNVSRGMASEEARDEREGGSEGTTEAGAVEGAERLTEVTGTVEETISELHDGLASAMSYCGGHTLYEAQENALAQRITGHTVRRNGVHGDNVDR